MLYAANQAIVNYQLGRTAAMTRKWERTRSDSWAGTTADLAQLDEEIRQAEFDLAKMKKRRDNIAAEWANFRLFIFRIKKKKAALQAERIGL